LPDIDIKAPWLFSFKRRLILVIMGFLTVSIVLTMLFIAMRLKDNLIEDSTTKTHELSDVIKSSLTNLMFARDPSLIQNTLVNIGTSGSLKKIFIMDYAGRIAYSTETSEVGKVLRNVDGVSCRGCHENLQNSPNELVVVTDVEGATVQRHISVIENEQRCHMCHKADRAINGKLVIDRPMAPIYSLISGVQIIIIVGGILCLLLLIPVLSKTVSSGFNKYIREIDRHTTELKMLYQMVEKLSSTIDINELKQIVMRLLIETLGADEVFLIMPKPDSEFRAYSIRSGESSVERAPLKYDDRMMELVRMWTNDEIKGELLTDDNKLICLAVDQMSLHVALIVAKTSGRTFETLGSGLLSTIRNHLAIAFENARLYEIAITDELTQLYTQRFFRSSIDKEFDTCQRYGARISLLMIDIDDFKHVNDNHGHMVGDTVLKDFAALLKDAVRDEDLVFRYGGEEFTIILPSTGIKGALHVAERVRKSVEEATFEKSTLNLHITVSIGGSICGEDIDSVRDLIVKADRALYKAKQAGKNRVVIE